MTRIDQPLPERPELGTRDGLAYALFLPPGEPEAGVVIAHGAGSAKEAHFDFARAARAADMAALAYDARGHGRSEGAFGPGAIDDALAMCELLREHTPHVALRGSSMGGHTAIHAGARDPRAVAVVAICPATESSLLRAIRSHEELEFRVDVDPTEMWLESLSLTTAAASLAPGTALLLLHARGDEQVPFTVSQELHEAAGDPKRLLLVPGGHHRSLQHDGEMQAESLRWVRRAARARAG